jgi:hypothetical protein
MNGLGDVGLTSDQIKLDFKEEICKLLNHRSTND